MAKQTPNWGNGTRPDGSDGDTFLEGTQKLMDNINEIYAMMGEDSNGVLPPALPVSKGGTGASTAAAARTNLGLGSAALGTLTTSITDTNEGRVLRVGDFGLGLETANIADTNRNQLPAGFYNMTSYTGNNGNPVYGYGNCIKVGNLSWQHILFFPAINDAVPAIQTSINNNSAWTNLHYFAVIGRNVVVDGNGFVKAASPVLQLFADRIEPNDQAAQQEIVFTRHGVGDYTISGSTGLANEGWYIEQPKDANGNVYHAVLYEALENGDLAIKTYNKTLDDNGNTVADLNSPVDIKEDRFISIRLNPLPEDITLPTNPTIVDDEGNSAPSRYHYLEDGVWLISESDAEILEQQKLAQMPSLTRRQFRRALVLGGINLDDIEAMIATIEDAQTRQLVLIDWQDSAKFERTDSSLLMMADMLGLTRDQVNELWALALTF